MTAATDFLEAEAMKHFFMNTAPAARPTAWAVALHSSAPTDAAPTTGEISGNAYARQAVTWNRTAGVCSNVAAVTFPAATPAGYTVTHVSVWETAPGANCLFHGALAVSKTLLVNESISFAIGELLLSLD